MRRRRIVAEKYLPLVEALYDGSRQAHVETQVTFEDGRTGVMKADLAVHDAATFPPAAAGAGLRQAAE